LELSEPSRTSLELPEPSLELPELSRTLLELPEPSLELRWNFQNLR
jgi:hypothetical protein